MEVGGGDAFLESIHLLFTLGKSISLSFPGCTVISAKRRGKRLPASLHLAIGRRFLASAVSTKPRWHAMWNYCWTLLTACQRLGCRLHGLLMPRPRSGWPMSANGHQISPLLKLHICVTIRAFSRLNYRNNRYNWSFSVSDASSSQLVSHLFDSSPPNQLDGL